MAHYASNLITIIVFIALRVECAAKIPGASRPTGADWYCETICAGGCGGTAHFSEEVCHCTITERIDDGDMEMIRRAAKVIGMTMEFNEERPVREVDESKPKELKFPLVVPPLKPLFGDLKSRLHPPAETPEGPIVGQMDPSIMESEPHHNLFAPPGMYGGRPQGFRAPLPAAPMLPSHHNIAPALTKSLLMNVREKLDALMLRTEQHPYQPAVTAHETESMRNTLKQITQVNVNVRPHGTTWGYIFNNLVNQLGGLLRQEAPNATRSTAEDDADDSASMEAVALTLVETTSTTTSKSADGKRIKPGVFKNVKQVKPAFELGGKKTTLKSSSTTFSTTTTTPTTTTTTPTTTTTTPSTTTTSESPGLTEAKFLPVEEGDDVVGEEEYGMDYEDDDHKK